MLYKSELEVSGATSMPSVSIIIPTFNSMTGTKNIEETLKSITSQTYPNVEILIVDNFSKDATHEICRRYPVRFFQLKGNRSQARNYGIDKMSGDYALFVDSDFVLEPDVVEECVSQSMHFKADCVVIPVKFVSKSMSRIDCSQMRNIELGADLGLQSTILFYTRELIRSIQFPESVEIGEDMIFSSIALERKPNVSRTSSMIYHVEDGTTRNLILRSWNYGKKFRSTISGVGARGSTRLILDLSALNVRKLRKIVSAVSDRPGTGFCFLLYVLLKHSSFAVSYCFSLLTPSRQICNIEHAC
jgi:glycosyltransferase involved in cell wall biosynthesis